MNKSSRPKHCLYSWPTLDLRTDTNWKKKEYLEDDAEDKSHMVSEKTDFKVWQFIKDKTSDDGPRVNFSLARR